MLHFTTNAPLGEARNIVHGCGYAEPVDGSTVVHVVDRFAMGVVDAITSYGWSIKPGRPRAAIADPTFALAMQSIERSGGSSAPAAAFAR